MGSVNILSKPESDSIKYAFVEDQGGKLRKVSFETLKNLLNYISANDDGEIVSWMEPIEGGIKVTMKDGASFALPISQAKEFESVEYNAETHYLHFYDANGDDVYDPVYIEGGGGGGGDAAASSSVVRLTNQNGTATITVPSGKEVNLMFDFTSTEDGIPTGDGTCQILVNGAVKATFGVKQGLTTVDVSPYLTSGSNNVRVKCSDVYGVYKTLAYTVSVVDMYITSTFDASMPYSGDITFKYTPYGAIEKNIHILIDGTEKATITIATSGKQQTYLISALPHGTHTIDIYATAELDGTAIESKHLTFDIICREIDNTSAMISSVYDVTAITQGSLISIPYVVYDPTKLACDVSLDIYTLSMGAEVMYLSQKLTVDRSQQYWNIRRYPVGDVHFRIKYGDVFKEHVITVTESSIQLEPEENDLELSLISEGRSNNEENPATWVYGDYSTTFTGFNWKTDGWVVDDDGDICLRLNNHARAEIQFKPFKDDLRIHGKTIEIEFAVRDANSRDEVVLGCMMDGIGFEVTADTAHISSEQSMVFCKYREEEKVKIAFTVESRNEYRMLSVYLNGTLSDVIQYPESDNFQQSNPVNISIGSSKCGIDIYTIRSYSTALTAANSVTNYIADMDDVVAKTEAYERNDIYDEYGNISFEKCKTKNSIMVIIGDLPQSKGDKKNVQIQYYDVDDGSVSYLDEMTVIDVQGTSSQFFVRKNWKLKSSAEHYIDKQHLPAKVICIKVDYAEATGTHNTQNANFINTLYSEKFPAQIKEPKCRSTIYGKPILLFHKKDAYSDPVFYGKANYNYDKGAEYVFGFTDEYDVECWEFKNNTSSACNFLSPITTKWSEDFESRYPEDNTNLGRFNTMHSWVVSTRQDAATGNALATPYVDSDGITHKNDTAAYRLAKFKKEFEIHFDMHYALIYYVYTFFALMVDQRAKNMFLTYWGETDKWQPWFYDNDTCFGINNEGQLVFDYYHEDTDQLDGANVYNGQNSVLWTNFRQAFPEKIKETYQNLRNNRLLTYDKLIEYFITNGSDKWSESIYNEDGDFKYISMLRSDNDASNLSQVRGTGEEHFRYMVENRLNYCDSKWYASDYADDYISLRIYTPTSWEGVKPDPTITVTPFSNMYAGVRYKANGTLYQKRAEHGESVTFTPDGETFDPENSESFNDTETAIYGAHQLSSIGDLAPLYCGSVNVSNADKIIDLKVGDAASGYSNGNLRELSVGTNRRLKNIDVRNCPNFASVLDLSGCPGIEEVYATGTAITGVEFPESGVLRIAHLPATITNFTVKHQQHIESVTFEGYNELKTLWVEKTPNIDAFDILSKAPNINRLRITDVNLRFNNASELVALAARPIGGIDENGANTDVMWIDGTCYVDELTGAEYANIKSLFPYLDITYGALTTQLIFMNDDGTYEISRQTIRNGGDGSYSGTTPTKTSTAQYDYAFAGWSLTKNGEPNDNALKRVEADRKVYASYTKKIRSYTVRFYNGSTLLQTSTAQYGSNVTYTGSTPVNNSTGNTSDFKFSGWKPSPSNITGPTDCYAQFYDMRAITDTWNTIISRSILHETTLYPTGASKELVLGDPDTLPCELYVGSSAVVYNDKIYIIEGLADSVWVYDDEWTQSYKLPTDDMYMTAACVYQNEMHVICDNGAHYKLSGSSWVTVSEPPFTVYSSFPMNATVYNNEIHVFLNGESNTEHYKWDGTTWTFIEKISNWVHSAVTYNDIIIFNTTENIYSYDSVNGSQDIYTNVNDVLADGTLVVYNNNLHLIGGGECKRAHRIINVNTTNSCTLELLDDIIADVTYDNRILVCDNAIHILGGHNTEYRHMIYQSDWQIVGVDQILDMQIVGKDTDELPIGTPGWFFYDNDLPYDTGKEGHSIIVYENKLHVLGGRDSTVGYNHYVWDGSTWTEMDKLPVNAYEVGLVVYNDELHLLGGHGSPTGHYKWDGTEWTSVSTLPFSYTNGRPAVYNDEIHIINNKTAQTDHYKWDGTEWTQVNKTIKMRGCALVNYKDKLYIFGPDTKYITWDGTTTDQYDLLSYEGSSKLAGRYITKGWVYDGLMYLVSSYNDIYTFDGTTLTYVCAHVYSPTTAKTTMYNGIIVSIAYDRRLEYKACDYKEVPAIGGTYDSKRAELIYKGQIYYTNVSNASQLWRLYDSAGTEIYSGHGYVVMNGYIYFININTDTLTLSLSKYDGTELVLVNSFPLSKNPLDNYRQTLMYAINSKIYMAFGQYILILDDDTMSEHHINNSSEDIPFIFEYKNKVYWYEYRLSEDILHEVTTDDIIRSADSLFTHLPTYVSKILAIIRIGNYYLAQAYDTNNKRAYILVYDDPTSEPKYIYPYCSYYEKLFDHDYCSTNSWPYIRAETLRTSDTYEIHGPKAALTFIAKELYVNKSAMSLLDDDYNSSYIKGRVCNDIFKQLPVVLQNYIIPVAKYCTNRNTLSGVASNNKIWIPSKGEVMANSEYDCILDDMSYEVFTDNGSRIRELKGQSEDYWLRDVVTYDEQEADAMYITTNGTVDKAQHTDKKGILFGFCI